MSRRTFIENVINLAVENCLMCDIPSILTPKKVNRMTEEMLNDLAAEADEVLVRRESLQDQIKALRHGLQVCHRHRRREMIGTCTRSLFHRALVYI